MMHYLINTQVFDLSRIYLVSLNFVAKMKNERGFQSLNVPYANKLRNEFVLILAIIINLFLLFFAV